LLSSPRGFSPKKVLIVNADDWGRSEGETNIALDCYRRGRISSVSAMVFMKDSKRAAELAKEHGLNVGLHLNFDEKLTENHRSETLTRHHNKIATFLTRTKWSQLLYSPFLRKAFSYSCQAQLAEFTRLFGKLPSHIDGHHHMHLCANVLLSREFAPGTKMRRNFSFSRGEKSIANRIYRAAVDAWLGYRYVLTDYFFDLSQSLNENKIQRVIALARAMNVELMTHPIVQREAEYLQSEQFGFLLRDLTLGSYANLKSNHELRPTEAISSAHHLN
jgi:predicted glycoside hydrolase/deacetylase ChbG (UPF0249 family)